MISFESQKKKQEENIELKEEKQWRIEINAIEHVEHFSQDTKLVKYELIDVFKLTK